MKTFRAEGERCTVSTHEHRPLDGTTDGRSTAPVETSGIAPVARWSIVLLVVVAMLQTGCLPRTTVVKNPGPHDKGVRYYRPKPYLFVRPLIAKDSTPVPGMVELSIEYLPDFSEEYSIHVRSGLGTNETQIQLAQGWNLTALNVDVDSQFDESVRAVGELVDAAMPALTAGPNGGAQRMVVPATNVPLGLYESVVSMNRDGTKRLYGFRYVGFMPYAPCPIESGGVECHTCYTEPIYGLVFENGSMVFKPLLDVPEHKHTGLVDGTELSTASREFFLRHAAQIAAQEFSTRTGIAVQRADALELGPQEIQITLGLSAESLRQYNRQPSVPLMAVEHAVQQQLAARLLVRIQLLDAGR